MKSRIALLPIVAVVVGALSIGVAGATTIAKPTALTATPVSASAITLHWTDASTNETGFEVQRSPANKSAYKKIATAAVNSTTYTDSGLTAATAYKYRVRALKPGSGASSFSNVATATTLGGTTDTTKPSVPAGLAGTTISCTQINLAWNASTDTGGSGLKGYSVWRDGTLVVFVNAPATTYQDHAVTGPASYSYQVQAVDNANNYSAKTTAITATTPSCGGVVLPSVPTSVVASPVAGSCSSIIIAWHASTPGTNGLKDYIVTRDGAFLKFVTAPTVSTADDGLLASHTYSYTVQARDTLNNPSAPSASATAATPACTTNPILPVPQAFTAAATSCGFAIASWSAIFDPDHTYGITKFNLYRNGALVQTVNAPAITAIDTNLSAQTTYSYAVTALDSANHESAKTTAISTTTPACQPAGAWAKTFGGSGAANAKSVATDAAGDVIVGGTLHGSVDFGAGPVVASGPLDVFVAKYSPTHALLWVDHFTSSGFNDEVNGLATDAAGDVYLAGDFVGTIDLGGGPLNSTAGGRDAFVASLSPTGQYQWAHAFGGTNEDVATSVAVDTSGNPVFSGYFKGTNVDFGGKIMSSRGIFWGNDSFVVKYSAANGTNLLGFPTGCFNANANGVAVDSANNIVITGSLSAQCNFGGGPLQPGYTDIYVAKYSPTGAYVWAKSFGQQLAVASQGNAVAVDGSGNVIITGIFPYAVDFGNGPIGNAGQGILSAFVAKFAASGAPVWSKAFGHNEAAYGNGVAADSNGNVTVVGTFTGIIDFGGGPLTTPVVAGSPVKNAFVAEYSPSGAYLASHRYGEAGYTQGLAVAAGPHSAVVTGFFSGTVDLGFGPTMNPGHNDFYILNTGA